MNVKRLRLTALVTFGLLASSPFFQGAGTSTAVGLQPESASGMATSNDWQHAQELAQAGDDFQARFGALTERLSTTFPDYYVDRAINGDRRSGVVRFTGDVPTEATDLASSEAGVEILIVDAPSRAQQLRDENVVMDAVAAQFADHPYFAYVDHHDRVVHVEISEEDATATGAQLWAAGRGTTPDSNIEGFSVALHGVPGDDVTTTQALHAGLKLFSPSGAFACSTAFSVKKAGGPELGILTAGHCPGNGVHYGTSTSPNYFNVLPYSQITDDAAGGGDFRWLHSTVMLSGATKAEANNVYRYFGSSQTADVDDYVCRWGWTTNYGCGYISYTNGYANVTAGDTNQLRRVGPLACISGSDMSYGSHTQTGDSGGPWFNGTTAYGIHSVGNGSSNSCFSQVRHALARFSLQLWTG